MYQQQLEKQREILREDMFAGYISVSQYLRLDAKLQQMLEICAQENSR